MDDGVPVEFDQSYTEQVQMEVQQLVVIEDRVVGAVGGHRRFIHVKRLA